MPHEHETRLTYGRRNTCATQAIGAHPIQAFRAISSPARRIVISIKQIASKKNAHRITETHTRALVASQLSGDFVPSNSSKKAIEESNQLRRAAEDNGRTLKRPEDNRKHPTECSDTGRRQVGGQARNSQLPGEMGEKRLAYDAVVIKINNKKTIPSSPEGSVACSLPPIPSSPSSPLTTALHLALHEPILTPTDIQQVPVDAVSKEEETSAVRHLPETGVAHMLPIHSPALPMQAVTLRQPLDEAQQHIGITLRRPDLCVVNTKPLSSDTHSLKTKTARKQSKAAKTPSVGGEGKYLERAMAYVRERMSRHALACDVFVPRAHKELPDKVMEGLVTMDTTSARMYSPHAIAALMPLVPSHDAGLLPNSISPADGLDAKILPTATHDTNVDEAKAGLHGPQVVNKEDKASVTRSPEDESVRAEELSLKPAKAAPGQPEYGPDLPSMGKQELLIGAANVKCSDEHPPYCEAPTLPVPVDPDLPKAADAKRPSQEAVNKIEMSILLRSPESPVALTPPMLADPLLAHGPPRSNQESEFRLRWKPPDTGKRSTQHSYQAINNRMQQSATRHSPPPGAAYMLPVSRYSPAYVTQPILPCRQSLPPSHTTSIVSHNTNANAEKHLPILTICLTPPICQHASAWASLPRLLNVEVVWRARCKPPDMFDATPQCSTTV
ncbi:hypothetical protein AX14_007131, partial [Amanita brunnescens Koide BX004]